MHDEFLAELLASAGGYVGGGAVECTKVVWNDVHNMELVTDCRAYLREVRNNTDPRLEVITEAVDAGHRADGSGGASMLHYALGMALEAGGATERLGIDHRTLWAAVHATFRAVADDAARHFSAVLPAAPAAATASPRAADYSAAYHTTPALRPCAVWPTPNHASPPPLYAAPASPQPSLRLAAALAGGVASPAAVQVVVRDPTVPLPKGAPRVVAVHGGPGSVIVVPTRAAAAPVVPAPPLLPAGADVRALFVMRFEAETVTTQGAHIATEVRVEGIDLAEGRLPAQHRHDAEEVFRRVVEELGVGCVIAGHVDCAVETWLWDAAQDMGVHLVAETPVEEMQRLAHVLRVPPLPSTLTLFEGAPSAAALLTPHVVPVRLSSLVPNDPHCVCVARSQGGRGGQAESVYLAAALPGVQPRVAHLLQKQLREMNEPRTPGGHVPQGGLYEVVLLALFARAGAAVAGAGRRAVIKRCAVTLLATAVSRYLATCLANAGVHPSDADDFLTAAVRVAEEWLGRRGVTPGAVPAPVLLYPCADAAGGWMDVDSLVAWESAARRRNALERGVVLAKTLSTLTVLHNAQGTQ